MNAILYDNKFSDIIMRINTLMYQKIWYCCSWGCNNNYSIK